MKQIWKRFTTHFIWKLSSLVLAILLWFGMVGDPELTTIQEVPVLYPNLPKGLLLSPDTLESVHLELRGPSGRLTRSKLSEIYVSLDLGSTVDPGTQTFTLSGAEAILPDGVSFVRAVPSQVRLTLEERMERAIPVKIRLDGELPNGQHLLGSEVTPQTLRISGPVSHVKAIESAETDLVDLRDVSSTQAGSTEVKVQAFVPDPLVQLESSPVVTVKLRVDQAGVTKGK